ncbi:MAG: pilus assembly PilX family protein [Vicinamibacterales bacterium]
MLFIALIVLVAMSMASVALVRSVDTATLGAGNIALKQSAAQAAERAVGMATAHFDPFAVPAGFFSTIANANSHQSAQNYCASLLPTDKRGVPLVLTSLGNKECDGQPLNPANEFSTANNERLRFVIERLCTDTGAPDQAKCTLDQVLPSGGTVGSGPHFGDTVPLYRVTVRVDGPRNTRHFSQVIFRP